MKSGSRQARRSDSHGGEHGERDPDETVAWRLMLAWHPSREFSRTDHRRKTAAQASRTVSERAARFPERPTNSSSGPAHVKPSPSGSTASLAATTCLRQPPRLTLPICLLRNTGCSDNRITRHRVFLHHLDLEKNLFLEGKTCETQHRHRWVQAQLGQPQCQFTVLQSVKPSSP